MERLKVLSKDLIKELDAVQITTLDIVKQCNLSILLCRDALIKFKKEIAQRTFKDVTKEIEFFKEIKSIPLSNFLFFSDIRSFETRFPKGNKEAQKVFTQKKIDKINRFYIYNIDFVQYIEQDRTYLDDRYFTRAYFNPLNTTHSKHFRDPEFNTSHDQLLAKLKAHKKCMVYLKDRLQNLGKKNGYSSKSLCQSLKWTGTKTEFTELIYALYQYKAINDGKTDIKEVAATLSKVFDFDLGDFYKTYSDIKSRKKSRTKFLDDLSVHLISRMNNDDL